MGLSSIRVCIYIYTRMIFHGWCMSVSLLYGVYQRLNKKIMKCICHGNDIRYMYSNATCTYHSGFLIITRYSYRILLYNCNEIFHFKAIENNWAIQFPCRESGRLINWASLYDRAKFTHPAYMPKPPTNIRSFGTIFALGWSCISARSDTRRRTCQFVILYARAVHRPPNRSLADSDAHMCARVQKRGTR